MSQETAIIIQSSIPVPVEFWAVGSSFGATDDQTKDFLVNNYWRDGWGIINDERNKGELVQVQKGDYLVMKSSATRGRGHNISFTRIKAIGKITGKANYFTFFVKWFSGKPFPKDFDNIWYSKTIERLREDELSRFVKVFIKGYKI